MGKNLIVQNDLRGYSWVDLILKFSSAPTIVFKNELKKIYEYKYFNDDLCLYRNVDEVYSPDTDIFYQIYENEELEIEIARRVDF